MDDACEWVTNVCKWSPSQVVGWKDEKMESKFWGTTSSTRYHLIELTKQTTTS